MVLHQMAGYFVATVIYKKAINFQKNIITMADNNTTNYVKIILKHYAFGEEGFERLWATKVQNGYQLDNIPFYAKNYSLNDIVSIENLNGDFFVRSLVQESGHSTIRVLFKNVAIVQEIRENLKARGCSSELSNLPNLIALDIPTDVSYSELENI